VADFHPEELSAHASYSSLSTFLDCGERYRLQKVVKITEIPAWFFVGGSAVHAATEEYDRGSVLSAEELFIKHFEKEVAERKAHSDVPEEDWSAGGKATKAWPERQNRAWWVANGPAMVQDWMDWRARCGWQLWSPTEDPNAGIELAMMVTLGDIPVKMFVDRVFITGDGQLVVTDIKSGSSEPESATQLGLYACGLELTFGLRPQLGGYWMARKKGGGDMGQVYDLEHLTPALMGRWISDWNRARRAGIFIPHPTRWCRTCGVRDYCAAVGGKKAGEV